jgi:hypothetical protein
VKVQRLVQGEEVTLTRFDPRTKVKEVLFKGPAPTALRFFLNFLFIFSCLANFSQLLLSSIAKSQTRNKHDKDMPQGGSVHSERGVLLPLLTSGGE